VSHPEFDRAKLLRRRMSQIRQDLDEDVEQMERSARTLMNWRYYTDNHPLACVAVAAALGYLVVPRRLEIERPDPESIEKLAKKRRLVVEQKQKDEAKGGLMGSAFSFVSGLVLKTVMAQAGHQLASVFAAGSGDRSPATSPQDQAPEPSGDSAAMQPEQLP